MNPDVAESDQEAVEHYETFGQAEDRDFCFLFDSRWYRNQFPYLGGRASAIEHYLTVGGLLRADPSPVFDARWYVQQLGEGLPNGMTALEHYLSIGWSMPIDPHPLFSNAWYVERNSIVRFDGLTPYEHFLQCGWQEGFEPGPIFSNAAYNAMYDDVRQAGINPFLHYVTHGLNEGRRATAVFDDNWYVEENGDDPLLSRVSPIAHYVCFGSDIGRKSSSDPLATSLAESRLRADRRSRISYMQIEKSDCNNNQSFDPQIDWDFRVDSLHIEMADDPLVSVIIPTLNGSEHVIRCLESIADAGDVTPAEIIVVDDGSEEPHRNRLSTLSGVTTVVIEKNVGFAGACTAGIEKSRGSLIMLLNNDTEVLPGWLDGLVREMNSHPKTGIAGSMLVQPDLKLQEAGCIAFSNGDCWQYGRGQSPLNFRYRHRREVDYCSGASLLIRREIWELNGGFDDRFSPAYYEDTDLCFAARELGFNTVYQPESTVIHNEGSSHGRDGSGLKRYQFRNKEIFAKKWSSVLLSHRHPEGHGDYSDMARLRDRRRENHVIVVDSRVPQPDYDSGSLRLFRILEALIKRDRVVHFLPANLHRSQPFTQQLENLGVEVISGDYSEVKAHFRALSPMAEFVMVARPEVFVQYLPLVLESLPTVPIAFDMVDAYTLRLRREAALLRRPEMEREALRLERLERTAARVADVVVTVSEPDEQFISNLAGVKVATTRFPNVHLREAHGPDFEERSGLLFVGGYEHPPNVDAALYMINKVWPLVQDQLGDVRLVLAGSKPPPELTQIFRKNLVVTGWVPHLKPLYDSCRVVVAPLRVGAGVKGKIGEALSFGVPTVTTDIGVEGLDLCEGEEILVGNSPEDFAQRVVAAYTDRVLWEKLRRNGAEVIEARFGYSATMSRVDELLETMRKVDKRTDR